RLGRARVAAAAALAVMAALPPALDGGAARWRQDARLPAHLFDHALAGLAPRATVDPGTPGMEALLRYGAAVGLRPDLTLPPPRPPAPRAWARCARSPRPSGAPGRRRWPPTPAPPRTRPRRCPAPRTRRDSWTRTRCRTPARAARGCRPSADR